MRAMLRTLRCMATAYSSRTRFSSVRVCSSLACSSDLCNTLHQHCMTPVAGWTTSVRCKQEATA